MTNRICDSCRRLRLKCEWDLANTFAPCCYRCKKYGLRCQLDGLTWPAWAHQVFISEVPKGFSRLVYWGSASNAGGHPMDLHAPNRPPPDPQRKQIRCSTNPSPDSVAAITTTLDISSNVKSHLYSIFFDHLQSPFPVVSRASLQQFPSTTFLEAAILGTAARHHSAIASWRDIKHIQEVIAFELRAAVGLQQAYQPKIQTLQALLLLSMKPELATKGHGDIMSIPLRLSLLCQMAEDLGIDKESSAPVEDRELHAMLWKACLFQDAFICAIFGQPLNICVTPQVAPTFGSPISGRPEEAYFLAAVEASHCLRHLLTTVYATRMNSSEIDLVTRSQQALEQLRVYERALEAKKHDFTVYQHRALRIFHHNNRLLFVLGLASFTNESRQAVQISNFISQEAGFIIPEACETLMWFSIDFLQSMSCRLDQLLYCESRAAMIIVDVLLESRRTHTLTREIMQNLENAVVAARTLKNFLMQDSSWGTHWTQGHTLEAVLARLEDTADHSRPPMSSELKRVIGLQPPDISAADTVLPPATSVRGEYDFLYDEELLNNILFNSTDWNTVLMEYNDEFSLPAW